MVSRIGFTNGCFDLLHEGHLHLLRSAREHCDMLYVAINSDESVRRLKGEGRPVNDQFKRRADLRATGLCHEVFAFTTEQQLRFEIRRCSPDILFKGAEYRAGDVTGWNMVREVMLIPMLPDVSTTKIIAERAGK